MPRTRSLFTGTAGSLLLYSCLSYRHLLIQSKRLTRGGEFRFTADLEQMSSGCSCSISNSEGPVPAASATPSRWTTNTYSYSSVTRGGHNARLGFTDHWAASFHV
ncbi:hypothetical protein PoB_002520100 [Plakobranchus ocellatus]|uniref:Secreted protein n=1 Tax=Plakobranchus ocellatus TaxID=259542 RepID=A0AAV3ZVY7_9GAST|nr:hypothetical protein PoB_002520100 [Plakobranchus ocellatus]